jgi:exopolyphosphatase/guanosine-5'-triphosphate,3'-diphosphate pyrophosphatase
MQIGAVRLSERARAENMTLDAARSMVRTTFQHTAPEVSTLIAVAGTPTSLASMDLELRAFDAQKIHGYGLSRASVDRLLTDIWPLTSDQIVMRYPSVSRGRADILAAGTVILSEAMKFVRVDQCTVSTRGLRYGIAMRAAIKR